MNVEETPLPGIGIRQDFLTRSGKRVGVITRRDGRFELIVSRHDDPDACSASIPLTSEETTALSSLLGAPHLVAQTSKVDGIETRQLPVGPDSEFAGRTLGDTALRSRTGVSVVAVVRAGTVHASPAPEFELRAYDLLVAVGTVRGLADATEILDQDA